MLINPFTVFFSHFHLIPGAAHQLPLPFSPVSPLMGLRSAAFEAASPASEPQPQPLHRRIPRHHDHHHHFQSTALFITVLTCTIVVTLLLLLFACLFFLYRRLRLQKVNSGATRTTHKKMLSKFSTTTNSGITSPGMLVFRLQLLYVSCASFLLFC